jgi:hypothetical protein
LVVDSSEMSDDLCSAKFQKLTTAS